MTQASLTTFENQNTSGQILTDKSRVYAFILANPHATLPDIKTGLDMKHQTASARITNLLDCGMIEVSDSQSKFTKVSTTQESFFIAVEVTDVKRILTNAKERKEAKFQRVLKSLLSFDDELDDDLKAGLNSLISA